MNNTFKKRLINQLDEAEEYTNKVFIYLKELEDVTHKDSRLQQEIWNLCEAGELISNTVVELEYLESDTL